VTPRTLTARASYDRGQDFERDIRQAHMPAHVMLQRVSPPYRLVRTPRGLAPVVEETGVPDFIAAVSGVAVVFDAKATGEDRWKLSHLTREQAEHLAAWAASGTIAGVLLRWDARQLVYWLPWSALGPLWHGWAAGLARHGEASLTLEDTAKLGREVRGMRWWEAV